MFSFRSDLFYLVTLCVYEPEGYSSCPVCLHVCPQELICGLALVDVTLKALAAQAARFSRN